MLEISSYKYYLSYYQCSVRKKLITLIVQAMINILCRSIFYCAITSSDKTIMLSESGSIINFIDRIGCFYFFPGKRVVSPFHSYALILRVSVRVG